MLCVMPKEEVSQGQKVLVRNPEDDVVYRGRVLEIPVGSQLQVELIDYGNVIFTIFDDLFVYRDSAFHFLNPMAHLVHINGLAPDKLKSSPSTVFHFIETNYRLSGYLFSATRIPTSEKRGVPTVDLFFRDSGVEFLPHMFESFKCQFMAQTYYQPLSGFPLENGLDENNNFQSGNHENYNPNTKPVLALGQDGCYYPVPKQ